MEDDIAKETADVEPAGATDWALLRAQAEKLGITLSELQRREREKSARMARKNNSPVKRG